MRFMMLVRATRDTEAGVPPSKELVAEMMKFNEELAQAGALLALDGLHPSSKGARVKFSGATRTVTDGPFAETKELIAGFWLIQVKSKEEAIEWARRIPNPTGALGEVEIRQVHEPSDFPTEVFPPDAAARDQALRAELKQQAGPR
jgi:hypothetical protein